jgi:hypothetical protein
MIPGDGLSTGRSSLAELRFNDGSLARIGEQAIFRFVPKSRDFNLSNGTMLLLIPPGRGQTRIRTPNAAAAIRGSALFVRYNPESDTTIVGALTNSGIQVFNQTASQNYVLQAGQLMVVEKGQFQGLYDFDLRNFYQTSDLVRGLDLTKQSQISVDPDLASIQAETVEALANQAPITGEGVVENPAFLQNTAGNANAFNQDTTINNPLTNSQDNLNVDSFIQAGELVADPGNNPNINSVNVTSSSTTTTISPATNTKSPNDEFTVENRPTQNDEKGKPNVHLENKPTQDDHRGKPDRDDHRGKPDRDDHRGKPDQDDDDKRGKPDDVHLQNKPTQDDHRGKPDRDDHRGKPDRDDHRGKPDRDDDDKRGKPDDVHLQNKPTQDDHRGKPDRDDHRGKPDQDDDDKRGKPDDVHLQNKPTQDDHRGNSQD